MADESKNYVSFEKLGYFWSKLKDWIISKNPQPIVVEGTYNSGRFTPNSGQISWDDALEAYVNGATVVLKFTEGCQTVIATNYTNNLASGQVSWLKE